MKKIVAAEAGSGGLKLWFHRGSSFEYKLLPFSPFILLPSGTAVPENCEVKNLAGEGHFSRQVFFSSAEEYEKMLPELKKIPDAMMIRDMLQQALSMTGITLFEDLEFDALRRMQFSVISGDGESIEKIEVADNSGFSAQFTGDEAGIISDFTDRIKIFDPDLLEGFNCCRTDLPLLLKRAKKHRLPLDCGRDGSTFSTRQSRYQAAEKQFSYQRFSLAGRHVIDLLFPVQLYDAAHRDIEELTLPVLKEYFHLTDGTATGIISKLSEILLPAYFYRTRELPLGFQDAVLRGSGSALDARLIAEYLQRSHSIPLPEVPRNYAGALSDMEAAGVFHHVRHCDVRSLYPSLLLHFAQAPSRDEAGIFLPLLEKLRDFRLSAKDRARQEQKEAKKRQLEALQSSFKILINSFYGYLGFAQGTFNDYALAEKITAAGRELLGKLVKELQNHGAAVIEMDTDGIYFQMPEGKDSNLDAALQNILPPGIELEFDAEYPAMYSYKAKNYALLMPDDSIRLTGAALKSRALEPFQRKFILAAVTAKLHNDPDGVRRSFEFWQKAIIDREIPLEDLAKSEILSDSPENYRKKLADGKTRRSAAYELALASGKKFRAGDKIKFYVTGEKAKVPVVGNSKLLEDCPAENRDENSAYYLAKLENLARMFQ